MSQLSKKAAMNQNSRVVSNLIAIIDFHIQKLDHVMNLARRSDGDNDKLANDLKDWMLAMMEIWAGSIIPRKIPSSEVADCKTLQALPEDVISGDDWIELAKYYNTLVKETESQNK